MKKGLREMQAIKHLDGKINVALKMVMKTMEPPWAHLRHFC